MVGGEKSTKIEAKIKRSKRLDLSPCLSSFLTTGSVDGDKGQEKYKPDNENDRLGTWSACPLKWPWPRMFGKEMPVLKRRFLTFLNNIFKKGKESYCVLVVFFQ